MGREKPGRFATRLPGNKWNWSRARRNKPSRRVFCYRGTKSLSSSRRQKAVGFYSAVLRVGQLVAAGPIGGSMRGLAVVAIVALAAAHAACTTTGKRVGGAAVGGVFGAAVAGPVGAAAGAAAGAATAPSIVR